MTVTGHRVVKLAAGSDSQTVLPFGAQAPSHVAVDAAGNVYVTDGRVLRLAAGSSKPTVLWSDPHYPRASGVAVDAVGNVYFYEILSEGTGRLLKLPVQ